MSKNILVADDSSTMRKIILRSLQAVGVPSATEACDGEEAVNLFKQSPFDLVLTDWNMPKKNGLDVIREIRAINTSVPIIMVTTEAEKNARRRGDSGRRVRLSRQAVHRRHAA
jgi:two-component system chemotaxis response regulator CheY